MIFIWLDSYEKMEQLSCLHFPFLLRNGEVTGGLAGGWRWSVFRACFALHIYHFSYINGCLATQVVEARACDYRDLGSSPSDTLLFFHFFLFQVQCKPSQRVHHVPFSITIRWAKPLNPTPHTRPWKVNQGLEFIGPDCWFTSKIRVNTPHWFAFLI